MKTNSTDIFKIELNREYYFKGITWNAGWDFNNPVVIYSPIMRYNCNASSISKCAIINFVEEICTDLCTGGDLCTVGSGKISFTDNVIKEFKWRGWNIKNLIKRKKVIKSTITIIFKKEKEDEGYLDFDIMEVI